MPKSISAIIIDDEPLAREELAEQLSQYPSFSILTSVGNAIEGLKAINAHKPDVVFLDIQMPQITGIELLAMLAPENMPRVVFVTAYDEYAVQAFEDNAFDYLLKPIVPCRLNKTIERLHLAIADEQPSPDVKQLAPQHLEQIPCSGHNRIIVVKVTEIECAFSDLTGVQIKTANQVATSHLTLKVLEEKTNLVRCHRQYLVNPLAIQEIKLLENGLAEVITQNQHAIPVSRRYLKHLKELIGFY
jgi:two-component system LytT family response regulator